VAQIEPRQALPRLSVASTRTARRHSITFDVEQDSQTTFDEPVQAGVIVSKGQVMQILYQPA
jgi:hypothetical protein